MKKTFIPRAVLSLALALFGLGATAQTATDCTDVISNPSFESGFDDWTYSGSGWQTQSNSTFTMKEGSYYIEVWKSSALGSGTWYVEQTITYLVPGDYTLTVGAQNTLSSSTSGQTGAYIYAGDSTTTVTDAADYSVTFTITAEDVTIGFRAVNPTGNWIACDNFRLTMVEPSEEVMLAGLQARSDEATGLAENKMTAEAYEALTAAITEAAEALAASEYSYSDAYEAVTKLIAAIQKAEESVETFAALQSAIDEATELYADGTGEEADTLKAVIDEATALIESTSVSNDDVEEMQERLETIILYYHLANGTGAVPKVTTYTDFARGATFFIGRSTISNVLTSRILERGYCWSTEEEPTVFDNRSTEYFEHNGYLYFINDLEPATVYYMRPYCITTTYQVGYGDAIKVITLPKGTITYQLQSSVTGADEAIRTRITNAIEEGVWYYNNSTSIQGKVIYVYYSSGVSTAEASYSGYLCFGPSSSYQATGTAQHEMNHTMGIGQHDLWYGSSSPLRAGSGTGLWNGLRANELVQFLEDDEDVSATGDATHMWATGGSNMIDYGINGASEDSGEPLQYYANALLTQALGEDGLPPTGGFTTPSYTFASEDGVKYYIKSEDEDQGLYTSYLKINASGLPRITEMSAAEALANDSAAWYITFDPATCYYRLQNAATGKYLTYNGNGVYGFRATKSESDLSTTERFQMMNSRAYTTVGTNEVNFTTLSYWIIYPQAELNPPTLEARSGTQTYVTDFDLKDDATAQRWFIISADDVNSFDEALTATSIEQVSAASASTADVSIKAVNGGLAVTATGATVSEPVRIYSITGQMVARIVPTTSTTIIALPAGVYVVDESKYIVK